MKYLKQFSIILAISFLGEILNALIPLPIPAGIYGLIIMFIGLETRLIPVSSVKEASTWLLEIMPVMFIPAAVGILDSWGVISGIAVPAAVITVVSTVAVMGVSGSVTQLIMRHSKKGDEDDA